MINLNEDQTKTLLAIYSKACKGLKATSIATSYMLARDKSYARWKKAELDNDATKDNKSEFVVPLILSQVDSARAKLTNIFLTPEPIFEVVAPPGLEEVANQYTAIYEADSQHFGWKSELSVAFLDGLKYNQLAVEVDWEVESTYSSATLAAAPIGTKLPETEVVWAGNKFKRMDLYNTFYDTGVRPKDIHKEGDFAGYVELYSPTRLHRLLDKLAIPEKDRKEIYQDSSGMAVKTYLTPLIAGSAGAVSPEDSATYFDLPESSIAGKGDRYRKQGMYEVTKMYLRAIPSDLELTKGVTNPNQQCILAIYILNGAKVFSVTQLTNKHNYLPIVFCQLLDEGIGYQAKSFSHNLEDLQSVATMLITTEIKSNRRMLTDRGIYDPYLINKKDINSPNPSAKIPLRTSAIGRSLAEAYYPIPYEDRALGSRIQQTSSLLSFGNDISGLNQVASGQFVKGNKTNDQFSESMAASGQRILALSLNLEDSFFLPLKEITRSNILQFQPPDKILSQIAKKEVTITPEDLKKLIPSFKVADGLIPADRIANSELIITAIQTISTSPELASQYNVADMTVHLLGVKGLRDLSKFKFTPEQQKARQQQQAALATQQQGQPSGQPAAQPAQ
jgi:hypothetical protein